MKLGEKPLQNHQILHVLGVTLCWMTVAAIELASAQGSADETLEARNMLQQAKEAVAGVLVDCHQFPYLIGEIAKAQAKAGDVSGAMHTAAGIEDDSCQRIVLGSVIEVLKETDVQGALLIAGGIQDIRTKTSALLAIAENETRKGHVQVAAQAAAAIPEDSAAKSSALVTVAQAQVKAGDPAAAIKTLEQARQAAVRIPEDSRKAFALTEVAKAQTEAGAQAGAITTLEQALQAAGILHSEVPEKAEALSGIAAAQARAGDRAGAAHIFTQAAQIDSLIQNPDDKWASLSEIAAAQAAAGFIQEALHTISEILDEPTKVEAVHTIVKTQTEAGDIEGVLRTAGEIRNEPEKAAALREITFSLAGAGHVQEAAQAAAAIPDGAAVKARALASVARAQLEAGDRANALKTLEQALQAAATLQSEVPEKAEALIAIAAVQAKSGDRAGATNALDQAVKSAGGIRDRGRKRFVLESIARAQFRAGDVPGALETVASFPSNSQKAAVLCSVGAARAKVGDHAGVAKIVEQILLTAAAIEAGPEKVSFLIGGLGPIWHSQTMMKDGAGAARTLEQAFLAIATIQPEIPDKAKAFRTIAQGQVLVGDRANAARTLEQALQTIKDSNKATDADLRDIALVQMEVGGIYPAMQTAAGIRGEKERGAVLKVIAWVQAKSGDMRGAQALAASQSSSLVKAYTLLGIAEGLLERGDGHQSRIVSVRP